MSEKVWREFCEDCGCPLDVCCKPKEPVRLASESVDLKWLRGEIENFYYCNPEMEGANMALKHLLSIAEKEAKKQVSKK